MSFAPLDVCFSAQRLYASKTCEQTEGALLFTIF